MATVAQCKVCGRLGGYSSKPEQETCERCLKKGDIVTLPTPESVAQVETEDNKETNEES